MSANEAFPGSMQNVWKSERLTYRAIEDNAADRTFMHEYINDDPTVSSTYYTRSFQPLSKSTSDMMFDRDRQSTLALMVCLRTDETKKVGNTVVGEPTVAADEDQMATQQQVSKLVPIGVVILAPPRNTLEQCHHRELMLAVSIANAYQGFGYGPEAINWVLDWAFRFGGAHRVGLWCYTFNNRARKIYERLGFVQEGISRENIWFNRAWHGKVLFGMLESEWERLRDPTLEKLSEFQSGYLTPPGSEKDVKG